MTCHLPAGAALALVALLAAASSPARAQEVTTTTTYQYDPETLLPTVVEVRSSDGVTRRTVTTYAHDQNAGMEATNMLSQVQRTVVLDDSGDELACQETTWRAYRESYVPDEVFEGCEGGRTRTATFEAYDTLGRVKLVRDAAGLETEVYYGTGLAPESHAEGPRMTAVTRRGAAGSDHGLAISTTETYRYDDRGRVVETVGPNGVEGHYAYDGLGRLVEVADHDEDPVATYAYGYGPNVVRTTLHGSDGQPDQESAAFFDGLGRPTQSLVRTGTSTAVVTTVEYDGAGREWRAWRPVEVATSALDYVADATARAEQYYAGWASNGSGSGNRPYAETLYHPDPLGRPRAVIPPGVATGALGVRTDYGVASPGRGLPAMAYVEATDADGVRSRSYSDGLGRAAHATAALGSAVEAHTQTTYDAAGRVLKTLPPLAWTDADPDRWASVVLYDRRGLPTRAVTPDADGDCDGLSADERVGTAPDVEVRFDTAGRPRFTRDPNRRCDGSGDYAYATYDALGRTLQTGKYVGPTSLEAAPLAGKWPTADTVDKRMFFFDTPVSGGCPSGVTQRNVEGRLLATYTVHSGACYSYTADGLVDLYVVRTGSMWTTTEYAYDRQGRVVQEAFQPGVTSEELYLWYDYDAAGRLVQVRSAHEDDESAASPEARYTYYPDGQVATATLGDRPAQVVDYAYDVRGRLVAINDVDAVGTDQFAQRLGYETAAGAPPGALARDNGLVSWTTWRTPAPQLTKYPGQRLGYSFRYDDLGRLTAADFGTTVTQSSFDVGGLSYDLHGNITGLQRRKETGATVDALTLSYGSGASRSNRLAQVSDAVGRTPEDWDAEDATHTYDWNGNLTGISTGGTVSSVTYDVYNMPTRYHAPGFFTQLYGYDAMGLRVRDDLNLTQRRWVRDPSGRVIAMYEASELLHWNLYGLGLIGRISRLSQ